MSVFCMSSTWKTKLSMVRSSGLKRFLTEENTSRAMAGTHSSDSYHIPCTRQRVKPAVSGSRVSTSCNRQYRSVPAVSGSGSVPAAPGSTGKYQLYQAVGQYQLYQAVGSVPAAPGSTGQYQLYQAVGQYQLYQAAGSVPAVSGRM